MATVEDIAKFRRQIGDPVKADADVQSANGVDKQFALRFNNIFDEVVTLNGVLQTTGYDLNGVTGIITFDTAPATDTIVKVSYSYAAYTDSEATALIDTYGVSEATLEALRELLANAARFYNYQQGQTRAERQQVFQNLKDLFKIYQAEAAKTANAGAGSLTLGKRTNEAYRRPTIVREDLSRTDQWGG